MKTPRCLQRAGSHGVLCPHLCKSSEQLRAKDPSHGTPDLVPRRDTFAVGACRAPGYDTPQRRQSHAAQEKDESKCPEIPPRTEGKHENDGGEQRRPETEEEEVPGGPAVDEAPDQPDQESRNQPPLNRRHKLPRRACEKREKYTTDKVSPPDHENRGAVFREYSRESKQHEPHTESDAQRLKDPW